MNVIVANKYYDSLQGLNIDIIKSLNGEFDVDEIIDTFKSFFFQRMVLDITAIRHYKDIRNLQKLSISLDMDKVILLLDDDAETGNPMFLSQLISMGIYNFTRNLEGVMYLYNNPNSYRDVAQYHQINMAAAPAAPTVTNQSPMNQSMNSFFPQQGSYNPYGTMSKNASLGVKIIGIQNVTKQSGATTLTYMIKKELERNYDVVAIEVGKRDFMFFPDKTLISATKDNVMSYIENNADKDAIIVDLNGDSLMAQRCSQVIYLIEPSIIKLNKLMITDPSAITKLANKSVVLNQSMLQSKDVLDFEGEANLKVFYNMPPLDEREFNNGALNAFLVKLGFGRSENGEVEARKKLLGIF